MLKVGLLGAGRIAQVFHLPAWQKISGAKVVALCDLRLEAAQQLSNEFSVPACYTDFEEMLDREELDLVDICTPNTAHANHILTALDHDQHVLVEKPFVTSVEDADRVIQKAKQKKKKVMCAQHQRFRPESQMAHQWTTGGRFGKIYFARVQAIKTRGVPVHNGSFTNIKMAGGGPLMDLGAHFVDLAWWLMGMPRPVSAFGVTCRRLADQKGIANSNGPWETYDVEDFAVGHLRFENEAVLSIETSYLLNSQRDVIECEFFGTEGGLLWPQMLWTRENEGKMERSPIEVTDKSYASVNEIRHFIECIQNDTEPLVRTAESRTVVAMIEALYRSAREGKEIRLGAVTEKADIF